jgi:hypothetical protein
VVVTVAADGTKLPPFFIFKGQPGKVLEQQFKKTMLLGAVKLMGGSMNLLLINGLNGASKLYMRSSENAFLLVDQYKVDMMGSFVNACNELGVDVDYIPAGFTCVLQPIYVGFNAPLKGHICDFHYKWCIEKISRNHK